MVTIVMLAMASAQLALLMLFGVVRQALWSRACVQAARKGLPPPLPLALPAALVPPRLLLIVASLTILPAADSAGEAGGVYVAHTFTPAVANECAGTC